MSHSYISSLFHCVFSTKERRRTITADLEQRLHPFMGGIARENHFTALAIGGTEDHAHLLLALPATMPVAKAVQLIKGGASKWVHGTFPAAHQDFVWQEGYGAFSVSISHIEGTIAYINNQKEHHRKQTFEEFRSFLQKHNIEYDERYVFG